MPNYCCLFAHFNKSGSVNDSVLWLLQALSDLPGSLVFISNSSLDHTALKKIERIGSAVRILERENRGADFGAWKTALSSGVIPDDTDYLVLANDSVFGPFTELSDLIVTMETQYPKADYWGISDSYEGGWHIQSYFLVLSARVFRSAAFEEFWRNDFDNLSKKDIILQGEIALSEKLLSAGFNGAVLAPSHLLDPASRKDSAFAVNNTHFFWKELVTRFGSPFLKKELVIRNPNNLESVAGLPDFVEQLGTYPVSLIEQYITDYLNFIEPVRVDEKIAVVCHLFYSQTIYSFLAGLAPLRTSGVSFVFHLSKQLFRDTRFVRILKEVFPGSILLHSPSRGRDIGGKLAAIDALQRSGISSDYILIIHDKVSPHSELGLQWRDNLLSIIRPDTIRKVMSLFRTDAGVGIVGSEKMIRNEYNADTDSFRCTSSENIIEYIKFFGLSIRDYNFIAGTIFWIRSSIIADFFAKNQPLRVREGLEAGNALDFASGTNTHAWERMFSFIANSAGYKTKGV